MGLDYLGLWLGLAMERDMRRGGKEHDSCNYGKNIYN